MTSEHFSCSVFILQVPLTGTQWAKQLQGPNQLYRRLCITALRVMHACGRLWSTSTSSCSWCFLDKQNVFIFVVLNLIYILLKAKKKNSEEETKRRWSCWIIQHSSLKTSTLTLPTCSLRYIFFTPSPCLGLQGCVILSVNNQSGAKYEESF